MTYYPRQQSDPPTTASGPEGSEVLFAEDLARMFRISVSAARRRLAEGGFGPRFKTGKRWAVLHKTLVAFLEAQQEVPDGTRWARSSSEFLRKLRTGQRTRTRRTGTSGR